MASVQTIVITWHIRSMPCTVCKQYLNKDNEDASLESSGGGGREGGMQMISPRDINSA